MWRKIREWFSVLLAKKPGRVVLLVILLLNVAFILVAAAVIKALSLTGTEDMGYWRAVYYTVTMILDAGCIDYVVQDIGTAGVVLVIICLIVIVLGMILFTGAVIGYLTNYISGYIENANTGSHKLHLADHTVILNWNSRASEIVNDLLYSEHREVVVILVPDGKEAIERELTERIADTIAKEQADVNARAQKYKGAKRFSYLKKHKFKNNVTFIVREGDTFSTVQLADISLEHAKSIIILGNDENNATCKYEHNVMLNDRERGNPQTVKSLVQVAGITAAERSDDNQKIVVEIEDDWTSELVNKIIEQKQVEGKCNIIPVRVNNILGRLLSQFSLMPELNLAYRELFSNKGATFYAKKAKVTDEAKFTSAYLHTHLHSIPLSIGEDRGVMYAYYSAESPRDDMRISEVQDSGYRVKLNKDYWIEQKNVIILGHNSKIKDIMEGFDGFRAEWNDKSGKEIMNIMIIDDKAHLEKMDYYKAYPYVTKTVEADLYDNHVICDTIEKFIDGNDTDTSVLILSDDTVPSEYIDSAAIANLIYVSDIIHRKKEADPAFDVGQIDVIVEIINPKHYDIVKSYSVNNVVISNRYISKMITQLGEKDVLYNFYNDILSYDSEGVTKYESKEIYAKKVSRYFEEIPAPCTATQLIRAVYDATSGPDVPAEEKNHTLVLGYVKKGGELVLFSGNQNKIRVALTDTDKLIVYSNH
ncbi:MAG: hypothetical protein J1F33_03010 [Clostridiales bacterium]|nr:hypothetical protein [Clostridiales bacterium]